MLKNEIEVITKKIKLLLKEKNKIIVAVDGRCGSGKSTLAEQLGRELACNVFHMDDFFLCPEQRSAERLEQAGGNVDYERFLSRVLLPLSKGEKVLYQPFNCKTQSFEPVTEIAFRPVNIIEGTYSCHPELWKYYDLHIFTDISQEKQKEVIITRNGNNAENFFRLWIPLEEKYFSFYGIKEKCELHFELREES